MLGFYKEFKRRKMFRPIVAYAAFAFILIQVVTIVFPALLLPPWTITFIVVLVMLGFPITIFFAWVYDITPGGIQKTPFSSISTEDAKSRKILLPLTGLLTIVGGAFWIWYTLGDVTSGSDLDLQMGIKKSIAVFNFENLTGQKEGDFDCAGISEYISSVLTMIGKLDVRDRRSTLDKNASDLDIDFSIQGTLSELGGRRNLNVSLVNAKSNTNLFNNQYELTDEKIVTLPDTIIQHILTELKIVPVGNDITSSVHPYKNPKTFKLIGEGIYHYEQKQYNAAIKAFDSVLASDPENIVASYHKANSYFKLGDFSEAMIIYKRILDESVDFDPIQWQEPVPNRQDVHPLLCDNIVMSEEKDLAIMLLRGDKACRMICFNTASYDIVWDIPIDDKFVASPVIINQKVFLTSDRLMRSQAGEPTLYAYDISNGREIFIDEFPRDNQNQVVLFALLEKYNNISNNNSTILLSFNKLSSTSGNYREIALFETTSNSVLWKSKVDLEWGFWPDIMLINEGDTELLVLMLEHDIIALNNKTGIEVWRENFSGSMLAVWNQKILEINQDANIALWDPVIQKNEWQDNENREYAFHSGVDVDGEMYEFEMRMNKDVVLLNFTNGDLVAINYDGGFLNWTRERWTQNIGYVEKIWFSKNKSDQVFCLTAYDSLFTINITNGEIINRLATDGHDYNAYYDDSQNAMVLNNSEFLIGVDPINGDQLWKIKDNMIDKMRLIGNSIMTVKTVPDTILLINNYNRDNGNLNWSENINISKSLSTIPMAGPMCGSVDCAFCGDYNIYLEEYTDESLLLIMHDNIIKFSDRQSVDGVVRQKDVKLRIARTYEKSDNLDLAIKEYNSLLKTDQMNPYAHWELANIYQQKNKVNEAAKSLKNYYDLILPESPEGTMTINKLQDLSVLKWKKHMHWDGFENAHMEVDNERIFLFIDNNIEAYSINSSAQLWKSQFGNPNTSIVAGDAINETDIFFIKKEVPNLKTFYIRDYLSNRRLDLDAFYKASKYSLVALDKRVGKISWEMPLDIPGESSAVWMGVNNNKIIIQSIISNKMLVSAYNILGGEFLWSNSYDISVFYTSYDLTPAFYNGNLLLPLTSSVEYVNTDSGNSIWTYFDDDIDHISFFNQNSIQNNTMKFFIWDFENEYVVVDLDKIIEISGGEFDIESPELGGWINNIYFDVSTSGTLSAYKLPMDNNHEEVNQLWQRDFNSTLELISVNEQSIYLLDVDKSYIYNINSSGKEIKKLPLLWPGKNVDLTRNYFIVQSAHKLYVIPI